MEALKKKKKKSSDTNQYPRTPKPLKKQLRTCMKTGGILIYSNSRSLIIRFSLLTLIYNKSKKGERQLENY